MELDEGGSGFNEWMNVDLRAERWRSGARWLWEMRPIVVARREYERGMDRTVSGDLNNIFPDL